MYTIFIIRVESQNMRSEVDWKWKLMRLALT